MSAAAARRRVALSVGQRLFLGLLPALLAVALVVGLAYWGEYGRSAPEVVVAGAAVLAVVSLAATWGNGRYLARRIARLAGTAGGGAPARPDAPGAPDELDRIEAEVARLGEALADAESARGREGRAAAERLREQGTMLSATVRSALARLDEVRLPLHILLDAKFGALSENQEELVGTARDAADAMDDALRRLAQVADADRGALAVQREPVQVNDVVRAVLPLARAAAERRGGRLEVALEPGLPRVTADRVRLAQALALVLERGAALVSPDRPLAVTTARAGRRVLVTLAPAPDETEEAGLAAYARDRILATRLVEAQGGTLEHASGRLTIHLG